MLEFKVGSQDQMRTVTAINSLVDVARHTLSDPLG